MGLVTIQGSHCNYPIITCDACGEQITMDDDLGRVMVVRGTRGEAPAEGEAEPFQIIHKRLCHPSNPNRRPRTFRGSEDLDIFLVQLLHNVGLTGKKLARAQERQRTFAIMFGGVE